jgi:hypothetical protein
MSFRMVVRGCHQRFAVTAYFPTSALRSAKPLSNSLPIVLSMLKIVPKTRLMLEYGPALVHPKRPFSILSAKILHWCRLKRSFAQGA